MMLENCLKVHLLLLALCVSSQAYAQGQFKLETLSLPPTALDGLAVRSARVPEPGAATLVAEVGYTNDPLVSERQRGGQLEKVTLVSHRLAAQVRGAFALPGASLFYAGFDAVMLSRGETPPDNFGVPVAGNAGLGDLTFGGRVALLPQQELPFHLAVDAAMTLPSARWTAPTSAPYRGERAATLAPRLLLEVPVRGVRVMVDTGLLMRRSVTLGRGRLRDRLRYGLGVAAPLPLPDLSLHMEAFGSTDLTRPGRAGASALDALVGASWERGAVRLSGAAGAGLARGPGAPDLRLLLRVAHTWHPPAPVVEPPPQDADGDGIADNLDTCPYDAEDPDGVDDQDGCPDLDNDRDGVPDTQDACPDVAEDMDGTEDGDGCPDPDNDGDGLPDVYDRCPLSPEDRDDVEDEDGCPESSGAESEV